jgi:hypothetical protein
VAVVDYNDMENLQFILRGIDLVISTISGSEQVNLIDAARRASVRRFVPSEFEGALSHRPGQDDPLDRGSSAALECLRRYSSTKSRPLQFTVFSCGVFFERLAPGGLLSYDMGAGCNVQNQGDYMIDIGGCTAEIPQLSPQGRTVYVTLTSAVDVARFVAAAVDLGIDNWPREFKMRVSLRFSISATTLPSQPILNRELSKQVFAQPGTSNPSRISDC